MAPDDPRYKRICELYLEGRSYGYIRTGLHVTNATIQYVLSQAGIPRREHGDKGRIVVDGPNKEFWHNQEGRCGLCRLPLAAGMKLVAGPKSLQPLFLACGPCAELCQRIRWRPQVISGLAHYLEGAAVEPEVPQPTDGRYGRLDGPQVFVFADGRLAVDGGQGQWVFISKHHVKYPNRI